MAQTKELSLFSETEFGHRAPDGYPMSCPTLDLSTTWDSSGRSLFIYRPPSQIVSKIHQVGAPGEKAPEALTVTWKPDGQFLAVGWSDGVVRLMGLENNKAAHHIHVCQPDKAKITHIGWASSSIVRGDLKTPSSRVKDEISKEWSMQTDERPVDLPRELTFVEVDTALPKISPLPSSSAGAGEDAIVFTLRTGIDFLFQTPKPEEYDQVNVLIVGTSDGKLQLSIYDSFVIGSFQYPTMNPSVASQLVNVSSHPQIPTQALLLAETSAEPEEVHLLPMDLPFLSSSPINLSLLASKLTTLQKLLRYLKQTQLHMQVEWKNTRELPNRFLRSIQADLEDMATGPRGIVPALYHTAVTGHAHEPVREWLVESLAERGHKRWDKAVVSGLEGLRSLVHENFLPALERCSIILSRLRGLAQFYDTRDDIGFSVSQISRVMDIISSLSLVGHKILVEVMDELEHFVAFSTWLRFQIDRLGASDSVAEDLTEKEATMDNGKVLAYIERYLTESPLSIFFDDISKEDYTADWDHVEDGPSLLDVLDKQLKKREAGQPSMKALPHVDFLVNYVTTRSRRVFDGIAEAKKRSVRFGKPIRLSTGQAITNMDVKMCRAWPHGGENDGAVFVALASETPNNQVHLFHAGLEIVNGISTNCPVKFARIDLEGLKLVDLKFLDEYHLIVLCRKPDNTLLVTSVPVRSQDLSFVDYTTTIPSEIPRGAAISDFAELRLPEDQALRAVQMEVHDKSDVRGETPARICLLDSNRTTLRVFSVPA